MSTRKSVPYKEMIKWLDHREHSIDVKCLTSNYYAQDYIKYDHITELIAVNRTCYQSLSLQKVNGMFLLIFDKPKYLLLGMSKMPSLFIKLSRMIQFLEHITLLNKTSVYISRYKITGDLQSCF